jgi:hypothetical protein
MSRRPRAVAAAAALGAAAPLALGAQAPAPVVPPAEQQIAAAVAPAPAELRAGATVLGYGRDGRLITLRQGTNALVCLASDPAADRFHVACYHRALEPFMARGRALRLQGVRGPAVDSARSAEIAAGTLAMPSHPAALYSLTGPPGSFDAATGTVRGARPLYVVYIPFATAESTGLSPTPIGRAPWIMFPGTPKAHIMFTPDM